MKKIIWFIVMLTILGGCSENDRKGILNQVNPFIGTDGHGHTFPGATLPFGMVQLSPDTRQDNWDACSGYHYSDSTIMGFSHTHLSGTGVGDYGDIRLMPITGKLQIRPGNEKAAGSGYRSHFSHENEKASPGYYQVVLDDYEINAELSVTSRCGFHQYTFPATDQAYIIVDLKESIMTESNLDLFVEVVNDHQIRGYRRSSGWAEEQRIYFYAIFSRPFESYGIASGGEFLENEKDAKGTDIQVFVKYRTKENEKIQVKVGISSTGIEGAKQNLMVEIPDWNFNRVKKEAGDLWLKELRRIEIRGGTGEDRAKFYTALYHCYLAPNLFSDVDGRYRGHDGNVHQSDNYDVYTVFSLWDTYRALHPLMSIIQPGRTADFIRTFLDIYKKRGLLPVWELAGNETNCMIGYHAAPVIVDSYLKGIEGFDVETAYAAVLNSAMQDHFGLKYYKELGYIPAEMEGESISKTLEYAYDDWCIALMAEKLGKDEEYQYFMQRAQSFKNLYDPQTGFLRGKRNGMFTEPFDPSEVNFMLTEANTWQYTYYVPQDITGLKELMGGDDIFDEKLDEMFTGSTGLSGRQQADITGLIGQYAHGNEPSHHMAYLYNYVGKPYKSQKLVREIMNNLYQDDPGGLCGNEDCGQMSAWFVLSAMGFYPVTPAIGYYTIGSPLFEEITIHLENGNDFHIYARNNNTSNIYIQGAKLNQRTYKKSFITHNDLIKGGKLVFEMDSQPGKDWAIKPENQPHSLIADHFIMPVPYFQASSASFQEELTIKLGHIYQDASICYGNDTIEPEMIYSINKDSIILSQSTTLHAYALNDLSVSSKISTASFYKIHHNWEIFIKEQYSPQYTGGGDIALIDGQHGGPNFRTGSWQGYHGVDFEATIDMGKVQRINKISATFLQDQRSWIFMPERVEFLVALYDYNYRTVAILKSKTPEDMEDAIIEAFTKDGMKENGRFLRIKATNRKTCPDWHVGAGDKAWIFIDEIVVE
jgi:predicted alpha-1,2-mannosidase